MDKIQTIALFGGSFDPPHVGHKHIVEALLTYDFIDKIIVMPTFLNPFKSTSYAPSNKRFEWLVKIFKEYKKVEVSNYEIKQNKKVPTIQTVKYLKKQYSNIYLVIGADNLLSLKKWQNYDKLKTEVSFIVAYRDGIEIPMSYLKLKIDDDISSTALRKNITKTKLPKSCAEEIYKYYKRIL